MHPKIWRAVEKIILYHYLSIVMDVGKLQCRCYNNAYFARVGGISLMEMNYLEVDFLFGVAFDLNVTPATFASYCSVLQTEMAYLEHPSPSADAVSPGLLQHCLPEQDQVDTAAAKGCHRHKQQHQQLTV
jgi:hypothetical protein